MRISDWSSDVCSSDLGRCLGASVRTGERHLNRAVDIAATEPQVVATGEIVEPLVGDGEALPRCLPAQRQGIETACKSAFHSGGPCVLAAQRRRSTLGRTHEPSVRKAYVPNWTLSRPAYCEKKKINVNNHIQ